MRYTPRQIGQMGEIAAARYLRKHGYDIVSANYHTKYGEIDIIAFKDDILVFCEVKTRNNDSFASPKEHVTYPKQRRIIVSALQFMKRYDVKYQMRFDVIEVILPRGLNMYAASVNHIPGAFTGDDCPASF